MARGGVLGYVPRSLGAACERDLVWVVQRPFPIPNRGDTKDSNRCIAATSPPHSPPFEAGPKPLAKHNPRNAPHAELAQPNAP